MLTLVAAAIALVGLVLSRDSVAFDILGTTGNWLLLGVAVPLVIVAWRPGRWIVAVAVIVAVVPMVSRTVDNLRLSDHPFLRSHDGGVVATRAAAEHLVHGDNPYTVDFTPDLEPDHADLSEGGRVIQPNPVRQHYPYLPGAFLLNAPMVAAADAAGLTWDPRWLYEAIVVLALAVLAALRHPPWVRAAAIFGVANAFTVTYVAWGTNDAAAAALVVVATIVALRHPAWAAIALAVAVSFKLFLAVALVPLVIFVIRRQGVRQLTRWWPFVAVLALSSVPFFAANPGAFVDDTIRFNLGKTALHYPTSGLGLPATHPGTFHGAVLGLTALGLLAAGVVIAVALVRWQPEVWSVLLATAVLCGALLLPNRTFQATYLTDLTMLAGGAWLACAQLGRAQPTVGAWSPSSRSRNPATSMPPASRRTHTSPTTRS